MRKLNFRRYNLLHLHCEGEGGPLVFATRVDRQGATVLLNQILTDHEAHPNPLVILFGCAFELSKHLE